MSHGCRDRPPPLMHALLQDGHEYRREEGVLMRIPIMVLVPVANSRHCQYTRDNPADVACDGCRWKGN